MIECLHHPGTPADEICLRCSRPFCGSCLLDFMGVRTCGECKDRFVRQQFAKGEPEQPRRFGYLGFWLTIVGFPMLFAAAGVSGTYGSAGTDWLHRTVGVVGAVVASIGFLLHTFGTAFSLVGMIQRDRRRGFAIAGFVLGLVFTVALGVLFFVGSSMSGATSQ